MGVKEFFNLKENPFNNTPDIRFYYESEQHKKALTKLQYLVENRKGLGIVLGHIGAGKTTLSRLLLDKFDSNDYESALIIVVHSEITSEWVLKRLNMQLGVENIPEDKPGMLASLYRKLDELNESGKKVVILIDEAQMIKNKEVLEELRGILNFEDEHGKLITFILFGLVDLELNLMMDEPLQQRVAVRCKLDPLDIDGVKNYILHRLKVAGSKNNIFEEQAIKNIYAYSKGIPRVINTLCDNAMFESYLIKRETISGELIQQVAEDLGLL
jgi:type II secretory pathway predicted ATPase ExeA